MANIKDVAREAGVSIATVSRMIANKGNVSEDACKRIQAAFDSLGYRPNRVARQLRDQRSRILALIVSDIQNPFFGELCRGVEDTAQKHGLNIFVCNTDENPEKEQHYLELMAQEQVAGIIISPSKQNGQNLETFKKLQIPTVTVDRMSCEDFDAVLIDNTAAAQQLTQCVLTAGYKRIAGIFGEQSFTAAERLKGFESELSKAGLTPHSILRVPAFEAEGRHAMEQLLAGDTPPDAVVCSSALIATGAYRAIHEAGVCVPDTLGFACFDDPLWATFVSPAITVIRQPAKVMGETAAELLMKRIEDPSRPPSTIRLQGKLIQRGSLKT